jgi:two-component system, OmpR family, sensor histidine kinase RstB
MRRLYLRIYLAVVASLAVFALAAGFLWRQFADTGVVRPTAEIAAALAQGALPPAQAPLASQQAALERIAAGLRTDVTLFGPDRTAIAWVGDPLPPPARRDSGWLRRGAGPPAWGLRLADGRWLVASAPRTRRHPAWGLFFTLGMLALGVGVGAYPVVRRLTRRLENLQAGVESLGGGDLASRVKVEGGDEVARLAESFNRAAARIEQLVAAHKALLANASHELRTPLTRIRMALELMKDAAEPKRRLQLEQDIAELDALIDEILLASRLDAVQAREAEEDVDLLALAAEECARYEGAELHGEPVALRGDPRLLRRLIRNLLENAARHGAPPVEVRVGRGVIGAEIAVCDRGAGVPEAERERVFEPFFRHPGAKDGAGLGLALVRQIARRHGGDAHWLAREGGGSCFIVELA